MQSTEKFTRQNIIIVVLLKNYAIEMFLHGYFMHLINWFMLCKWTWIDVMCAVLTEMNNISEEES